MFAKKSANQEADHPLLKEVGFARQATVAAAAQRASFAVTYADRAPTMAEGTVADGVVIIGRGTRISGEITNCSKLEIHGTVEGRIGAVALIVREGGSVKGEIYANDAEINGNIEGHVEVKGLLDIRSTGRVEGELAYGKLAVAMGGHIGGQIRNTEPVAVPDINQDVVPISSHSSFMSAGYERH